MNPIVFALRRPYTVMVAVVAVALGSGLALSRMSIDIFPNLNLPVVYVSQPYGGMDPAQMEGLLTNYYEYHFLYINGIHHVESRNIQGMALMKLYFHPGTNMAQAMAEVIGYVDRVRGPSCRRARSRRSSPGSTPAASRSATWCSPARPSRSARSRTRRCSRSGRCSPACPASRPRRRSAAASARSSSGSTPTGSAPTGWRPTRSIARPLHGQRDQPLGERPHRQDDADRPDQRPGPAGPGPGDDPDPARRESDGLPPRRGDRRRTPATSPPARRWSTAGGPSTSSSPSGPTPPRSSVVNNVKAALPSMQAVLPDDIKVSFEFDQSPTVTNAVRSLATEGRLGAVLTGLMVLLFLRDWRSVIVVVLNIPFALCGAIVALWLTGQTINLMTLGGLALAIGILVDESTVEVENIHHQMEEHRLGRSGGPAGEPRRRRSPGCWRCSASWRCSCRRSSCRARRRRCSSRSRWPSASRWSRPTCSRARSCPCCRSGCCGTITTAMPTGRRGGDRRSTGWATPTRGPSAPVVRLRWLIVPAYIAGAAAIIVVVGMSLGLEIFPKVDAGRFQLRLRAPDGTRYEETERLAIAALDRITKDVGRENVAISIGYVGLIPSSYPINAIYQWTGGPEEAILRVAMRPGRQCRYRGPQGAAPRRSSRRSCRSVRLLVRAGGHRQRGDELRLADAGGRRRHRAEPRRRPGVRRQAPRRAGDDPGAARPPVRPVARLSDDQHRGRPRAGGARAA